METGMATVATFETRALKHQRSSIALRICAPSPCFSQAIASEPTIWYVIRSCRLSPR
jgi:hypothetical protein